MPEMRVLVPLDGSRLSEIALKAVETLAGMSNLKVRVISVVESVDGLTEVAQDEMRVRESNLLRAYLQDVAARLSENPSVLAADFHVLSGDPAEMIADQVSEFNPQLLVISTHGRSGLSRWRLGSVADAVVRSGVAHCLVVGPHARMHEAVKAVMVPLDGSESSERAIPKAVEFSKAQHATLHLVRVVDLPVSVSEQYQSSFDDLEGYCNQYLTGLREKISEDVNVCTAVRFGSPADRLMDYAASTGIDLIVMTSKGRGGIARTALGSVAGRIIGGPAPVLIVKPDA
jgi:nucleotide-binding universal stress UspA family protein